jgi:hypothetical protein
MPLLAYREEKSSIVPLTPPLALHLPRAATGTWISDSRMSRYGAGLTEKLRLGPRQWEAPHFQGGCWLAGNGRGDLRYSSLGN